MALCELLTALLKYAADADPPKQTSLSLDLYGSPDRETTIRANAWRLREQLAEYYANEGAAERIEIVLKMGPGYRVTFKKRHRPSINNLAGRDEELRQFRRAMGATATGSGTVLCVAGEAGLGKTALVDAAISDELRTGRFWHIARGGCSERLASTSAYLPVVEALETLTRSPGGETVRSELRRIAPTWYVQLTPQDLPDDSTFRLSVDTRAASPDRVKREFYTFLRSLSEQSPVILFIDDLHWADEATVDLLSFVCHRVGGTRILAIMAYRPSVLSRASHSLLSVKTELQQKHLALELRLSLLDESHVQTIIEMEFPDSALPADFQALISARTEGNPLFVVDTIRYLRDKGTIALRQGRWELAQQLDDIGAGLPESVLAMIDLKIRQLEPDDRLLLLAASVQGYEFDSQILADVISVDAVRMEERLQVLQDQHAIVKLIGERELPDQTLNLRYRFVHILYQHGLYGRLGPARRQTLSRNTAEALLRRYHRNVSAVAATVAALFKIGRDYLRAAQYMLLAAQSTMRTSPSQATVEQVKSGLTLLAKTDPGLPGNEIEFGLQSTLAACHMSLDGYSSNDACNAYRSAYDLGKALGQPSRLITPLWGLWAYHITRGDPQPARRYARETLDLAREANDPALLVEAYYANGITTLHAGDLASAKSHFSDGLAVYDSQKNKIDFLLYLFDPGVACRVHLARTLWLLGYPDTGLREAQRALEHAQFLGHPQTIAFALVFIALVHLLRREARVAEEYANSAIQLSQTHGFPQELTWAQGLLGWSLAIRGLAAEGVALIMESCRIQLAKNSLIAVTQFACVLAEALAAAGDIDTAIGVLSKGIAQTEEIDERYYQAELYRLKGEFLLRRPQPDLPQAEGCFVAAVALARRQGARALELRAIGSQARFWVLFSEHEKATKARDDLGRLCSSFTEGAGNLDLIESRSFVTES